MIKISQIFRDFRYFSSIQEEEKRNRIKMKYEEEENINKFPFHLGSHYSSSCHIYYYLMRQQPYDNLLVKLQGYELENTNRCLISINSVIKLTHLVFDNRELIPEFFSKIEYFLNLNCDYYGKCIIINNKPLDDCIINTLSNKTNTYLSKFVTFIIQHKILLNSKIIGLNLTKWIDIIFGINQLPPKERRKDSCIILPKYSYEQNVNLEKKLAKKLQDKDLTKQKIKNNIYLKISHILNLGIVPSQIFHEEHPNLKLLETDTNYAKNNNIIDIDSEFDNNDFESFTDTIVTSQKLDFQIRDIPLFFNINSLLNKIFIYDNKDTLSIYDCQLFNPIYYKYFEILKYNSIENATILNHGMNSIYQIKYGFSSFETENISISDEKEQYHTYYYNRINYIFNKEKIKNQIKNNKQELTKVITCRHLDFSFKIYYLIKTGKKKEITKKIFSYICEDFVTSCCSISSNSFVIGLNNGKLILFKINNITNNNSSKNTIKSINNVKLEKEKYIQAHKGKINVIEIDKRLGVIITAGDDNYVFIRKLYDFELLLPIKIKNKFDNLMLKVSSFNFLYILCFNKINQKKIIFGYTLSGLRFAKSEYGSYDNINITEIGNIITLNENNTIAILSGNDLTKIKISDLNEEEKVINEIKKINPLNWIQYDYFYRMEEHKLNRIITYFNKNKENVSFIRTLNLSDFSE